MIKKEHKPILFGICIILILMNLIIILKNPDCPFHVDYITYTNSINHFYDTRTIEGNVNGKHIYVYVMAILLTPFHYLKLNLYDSMVFVTGLFQVLLVYLFYLYTKSLLKTFLMATTLTFLTFIGHAETVILSTVFLMLYFIFRKKKYSEFFIMLASFIRLDSAIFYLFARKKTAIIPIIITLFQWLNGKFFMNSDLALNSFPFIVIFIFLFSFGAYLILLMGFIKPKNNLDCITHAIIIAFLVFMLQMPTQKVFFFPVMLTFMLYDFNFKKIRKYLFWFIGIMVIFNLSAAIYIQSGRTDLCTQQSFYNFAVSHEQNIHFGIFKPYLDYGGTSERLPYTHQLTERCKDSEDYMMVEDWRSSQLLFMPFRLCLEPYDGR